MREFRAEAARLEARPKSRAGAAFVIAAWLTAAMLLAWWFWPRPAG
jgi:hypothetical protein